MARVFLILFVVALTASVALAGPFDRTDTVTVGNSDELRRVAAQARPGSRILLKPGRYKGGISLANLRGTEGKPIVITAQDGRNKPIIEGGNENLHLVNPAYVELSSLVLRGAKNNGLNIDDGGSMKATAYGVKLTDLLVEDVKNTGNADGIKLSGLNGFTIARCTVRNWGGGGSAIDMVGCRGGRISDCKLQHRGAETTNTGIQCKGGTRDIVITYCRFKDAGRRGVNIGGSTGLAYFRPQPPPGYEAQNITVEHCTFIGGNTAVAFVGVDGATVRYNTIYRPRRWVFRILQENRAEGFVPSRKGVFEKNLVVWRSNELHRHANIGANTAPKTFRFEGNWWYCEDEPQQSKPNLPVAERNGTVGRSPMFEDSENDDLSLRKGSPAGKVGAHAGSRPGRVNPRRSRP